MSFLFNTLIGAGIGIIIMICLVILIVNNLGK